MKKLILSLVTGLLPIAGVAEDINLSSQFNSCMDKSGGVTADILNCIGEETKLQDARLNKAYKALMSQLEEPRKKQLQEAQRAWIKYRDANCEFYNDPDGGTAATINSESCILTDTSSRAQELEQFISE